MDEEVYSEVVRVRCETSGKLQAMCKCEKCMYAKRKCFNRIGDTGRVKAVDEYLYDKQTDKIKKR